ncbi:unnamed protein product [Paramecium octaurelia]|uniref:DNA-directed RNA polymerase subunit n=1 Tax=Paramecium octaurelia TaxID=43137 RepID=A0A8S1SMD9_PAROT|nr:unnamed protein product [Paramecium octaurelia]
MLTDQSVITKRIQSVHFGYYTAKEIREMSVKEISNPKAFDKLNHPIRGGLYDPALGVQPHERGTRCVTCGQENMDCTGHVGHIELLLPVYNPYLVNQLMSLMRSKCYYCHKLRITKDRKKFYKNNFKLLRLGRLIEMKKYQKLYMTKLRLNKQTKNAENRKQSITATDTSRKGSDHRKGSDNKMQCDQETAPQEFLDIEDVKSQIQEILDILQVKKHQSEYIDGIHQTSHILQELKILTKQFFKDINKKCPHCNKVSPNVRKEGVSKFFLMEKSEKGSKDAQEDQQQQGSNKKKNHYLNPMEISEHIHQLWRWDQDLLKYIYGSIYVNANTLKNAKKGYELKKISPENFFIEVLIVPANRYRPENKVNDQTFLHGHTVTYTRILEFNQELKVLITNMTNAPAQTQSSMEALKQSDHMKNNLKKIIRLDTIMQKWLELQDCVVGLVNSERAQNKQNRETPGVKQLLERKQGLFRMKMMGKRVNFACRSVISPDPLLSTNEVGVPTVLARKLIIPENVNSLNQQYVADLIMNGPVYPGALYFQEDGKKIALEYLTPQQRMAIVRELGSGENKVVWRHLRTGDVMLFNRQPSLHKPSIMGHIVRVLPNEQTIRFHYANCKSYNADFDGDEMNLHFIQSMIGRAEGYNIALNDYQYISQTNGKPLRELMQDMIVSSVFLTLRDTFLTKQQYMQLIYTAIWSLFEKNSQKIELLQPAILKPKQLWTGKQLISNIIKIIVGLNGYDPDIGLNLESKCKLSSKELPGMASDDIQVLIKDNELLLGIVDKNQVGSGADYGMMHAFHELYGPKMTGQLLTGFARLFAAYLQYHGFTCGMDDLIVDELHDEKRRVLIEENLKKGVKQAAEYCGYNAQIPESINLFNRSNFVFENGQYNHPKYLQDIHYLQYDHQIYEALRQKILIEKHQEEALDQEYKKAMTKVTSEIVGSTLGGLQKLFPLNLFSMMTMTGAKGSNVNHSQVSALLGQQELEGRRVPLMPTGRSLPSFLPYDPNPRAGGYVADRFLTGLRPQEFFFHCMAGREGLIDTAVKTSRSGYLQRCLIKHLEGLIVQYDLTVRDNDGSLIQLFYGEDGIDTTKTKYLEKFSFLAQNNQHYKQLYRVQEMKQHFKTLDGASVELENDTLMNAFNPSQNLGAVSMKVQTTMNEYLQKCQNELQQKKISNKQFKSLANIRYLRALMHPGEAVGCVAAQSIGEPSTQMTLNTFHLAGHGEKNVTLGIPRLREILMTATKKQKTPTMSLQFLNANIEKSQADRYAKRMSKLVFLELVNNIKVREYKRLTENGIPLHSLLRGVIYEIDVELEDLNQIKYVFGISEDQIKNKVNHVFIPLLLKIIQAELNKNSSRCVEKTSFLKTKENEAKKQRKGSDEEDDDDEDQQEEQDDLSELNQDEEVLNIINQTFEQSAQQYDIFEESHQQQESQKKQTPKKEQQQIPQTTQHKYLEKVEVQKQLIKVVIKLPLNSKKMLMTNVVKKTLSNTVINEIKGINKAKIIKNDKSGGASFMIYTEGVNLNKIRNFDFINLNNIDCNDIVAIMNAFGIEAARNAIIKEILAVFGAYGVAVDYRHLYLIADYMTFGGQIRAMNRIYMDFNTAPFGKMTFETSTQFLTNACLNRETDTFNNLSSQLVIGRVPKVGSNLCDVLYQFETEE